MRKAAVAAGIVVAGAVAAATSGSASSNSHRPFLSEKRRLAAIKHAQVWAATPVASMDLRQGPTGHGAFPPGTLLTCDYLDKPMGGRTPKFGCALTPDDEVKVKYGISNGEVYAEVAATRLFWALGFPADRMYPVRVLCRKCPADPHRDKRSARSDVTFDPAAVERHFDGVALETHDESGWSWDELDLVDAAAGGAPVAQRDALKLLAVFVQHTDNKPEQQRMTCTDKPAHEREGDCAQPVMMVDDLGMTFGRANLFNRALVGSVNLDEWSHAPIWLDRPGCVGNLPISQTGTLNNPRIGDAGRRFLVDLLMQLSDTQLRDLFDVARFSERQGTKRAASTEEWVDVFKRKRTEIANRVCP